MVVHIKEKYNELQITKNLRFICESITVYEDPETLKIKVKVYDFNKYNKSFGIFEYDLNKMDISISFCK